MTSIPSLALYAIAAGATSLILYELYIMFFRKKKWDAKGKHCYITGGTAGLGLALALKLTKEGANVSIVARNQERLEKALKEMEAVRQSPDQKLNVYSFSVHTTADAEASLDAACKPYGGKTPDAMFLCAGTARPGFFIEQDESSLKQSFDEIYWLSALPALAATKRMVREPLSETRGKKIVLVSSSLGYFSIVGYSSYSPAKFAVRGLAEALHSELMLYGIDVHVFFPGTIFSPGLITENKTKPKVTLKIEERDEGMSPERWADELLKGVRDGDFHVVGDFIGRVFRSSTRGASPSDRGIIDFIYLMIGVFGVPPWRKSVDENVVKHVDEHQEYLKERGFKTS
ncbi:3-dehydrosphinganine reductase [Steccherinum ochraceum]|uniref:3-dehydrosphinganine reductase n=1 Tax=Steccherinum ochraceum TaxID=92696 RepID=A0A4R0RNZ6_9APHY|nr:3-dehydrosphinganine reductase [Steccherinum ochraceum]